MLWNAKREFRKLADSEKKPAGGATALTSGDPLHPTPALIRLHGRFFRHAQTTRCKRVRSCKYRISRRPNGKERTASVYFRWVGRVSRISPW